MRWYVKCVRVFLNIFSGYFLLKDIESKFHKTLLILMKSYLLGID